MFDSLFDSFTLFDYWGDFGIGRRGRKLLARGEASTATITGIKVSRSGDSEVGSNSYQYIYALDVRSGTGVRRLTCRQNLSPQRKLVHLGSTVQVRHRKDRVIIDWEATLASLGHPTDHAASVAGWKPLKPRKAPDGVEDHEQNGPRRRIGQGKPATATVLRVNQLGAGPFGGTIENVDVDVQLRFTDGEPRQGLLRKIIPPDYGAYLLSVGTVLPVGVDKGGERITVDWIAAANGETSTDTAPPVPTRKPDAPRDATAPEQMGGFVGGLIGKVLDASGMPAEAPAGMEIPFETYVEVNARIGRGSIPPSQHEAVAQQCGVPPGAWGPASRAWQSRMARDWKLSSQYSDAYEAAYQRLG